VQRDLSITAWISTDRLKPTSFIVRAVPLTAIITRIRSPIRRRPTEFRTVRFCCCIFVNVQPTCCSRGEQSLKALSLPTEHVFFAWLDLCASILYSHFCWLTFYSHLIVCVQLLLISILYSHFCWLTFYSHLIVCVQLLLIRSVLIRTPHDRRSQSAVYTHHDIASNALSKFVVCTTQIVSVDTAHVSDTRRLALVLFLFLVCPRPLFAPSVPSRTISCVSVSVVYWIALLHLSNNVR